MRPLHLKDTRLKRKDFAAWRRRKEGGRGDGEKWNETGELASEQDFSSRPDSRSWPVSLWNRDNRDFVLI